MRIKYLITSTSLTSSPINFPTELVGEIIFFHFSKSLVNILAEWLVTIWVLSLVNMFSESLGNKSAELLVSMLDESPVNTLAEPLVNMLTESMVKMMAKSMVIILAISLVNMLGESRVNISAESLVSMLLKSLVNLLARQLVTMWARYIYLNSPALCECHAHFTQFIHKKMSCDINSIGSKSPALNPKCGEHKSLYF